MYFWGQWNGKQGILLEWPRVLIECRYTLDSVYVLYCCPEFCCSHLSASLAIQLILWVYVKEVPFQHALAVFRTLSLIKHEKWTLTLNFSKILIDSWQIDVKFAFTYSKSINHISISSCPLISCKFLARRLTSLWPTVKIELQKILGVPLVLYRWARKLTCSSLVQPTVYSVDLVAQSTGKFLVLAFTILK